jgi:hypothetical protein
MTYPIEDGGYGGFMEVGKIFHLVSFRFNDNSVLDWKESKVKKQRINLASPFT